jgi:hypothetical protein
VEGAGRAAVAAGSRLEARGRGPVRMAAVAGRGMPALCSGAALEQPKLQRPIIELTLFKRNCRDL